MSTYLIAYEEALTKIIEKGGDPDVIDKAIGEYNTFSPTAFKTWLGEAKLKCTHCDKAAAVEGVEPLEEIACQDHRPTVATA